MLLDFRCDRRGKVGRGVQPESLGLGSLVENTNEVGVRGVKRPGLYLSTSIDLRIEDNSSEIEDIFSLYSSFDDARLIDIASCGAFVACTGGN